MRSSFGFFLSATLAATVLGAGDLTIANYLSYFPGNEAALAQYQNNHYYTTTQQSQYTSTQPQYTAPVNNVRPNSRPDPAIAAPAQKRQDYHEFDYEAVSSGTESKTTFLPEVSQTIEYPYYVITIKVPIVKQHNYDNPSIIEGRHIANQYGGSNVLLRGFNAPQYET